MQHSSLTTQTKHSSISVAERIVADGLVPVLGMEKPSAEIAIEVAGAIYRGGGRVFEVVDRAPKTIEVFSEIRPQLREDYPDLLVGAGSCWDCEQAYAFLRADADFIVGPNFLNDLITVCKNAERLYCPGCATPTEVFTAVAAGARLVKIFPGDVLGPQFVKSLLAPRKKFGDFALMITGGVEPSSESLTAWFTSGALAVGMGSKLITRKAIEDNQWELIENDVRETLALISKIRDQEGLATSLPNISEKE